MSNPHIFMIHGTWSHGDHWAELAEPLRRKGFTVHTPTLRHHDKPLLEGALKLGNISFTQYVDDLVEEINRLDSPPILMGWSMGGLLAQLVAARVPHLALILLVPAPAAGMFNFYPGMVRLFWHHYFQPNFWRKPLYPTWEAWRWGVAHQQSEDTARELFTQLCCESGRAYAEMGFWFLDPKRATRVDTHKIKTPVLVIGAGRDRIVAPRIGRLTARRYARGTYAVLHDSDHLVAMGRAVPRTLSIIEAWLTEHQLMPATP